MWRTIELIRATIATHVMVQWNVDTVLERKNKVKTIFKEKTINSKAIKAENLAKVGGRVVRYIKVRSVSFSCLSG